jgi:hypothetical protein
LTSQKRREFCVPEVRASHRIPVHEFVRPSRP